MNNYTNQENKWAQLVGHFILDFVSIENIIQVEILSYIHDLKLTEADITDKFEQRLNLFKKILMQKNKSNDIENILKKIKELKQVRNLIAHNGLRFRFSQDTRGIIKLNGFEIGSSKNSTYSISFKEFREKVKELKSCKKKIEKLLDQI